MTPDERADAYWKAHRMATDCSLRNWFRRCENDILEFAASKFEENEYELDGNVCVVALSLRRMKHEVTK